MKWSVIEKAIKEGCKLTMWASAGGCAVVELKRDGKNAGYGMTAGLYKAVKHCSEDYEAGGRDPKEVYGPGKLYPCYMTGSASDADELERWVIAKGYDFEAALDGEDIVITLAGVYDEIPNPKSLYRIKKIGRAPTFVEALLNAWLALPQAHSLRKTAA